MKKIFICYVLGMSLMTSGCTEKTEDYAMDIKVADLVGPWKVGGGIAKVEGDNAAAMTFTTETGFVGVGAVKADHVEVPTWKLTGKLTLDRKNIKWSNNVVWVR